MNFCFSEIGVISEKEMLYCSICLDEVTYDLQKTTTCDCAFHYVCITEWKRNGAENGVDCPGCGKRCCEIRLNQNNSHAQDSVDLLSPTVPNSLPVSTLPSNFQATLSGSDFNGQDFTLSSTFATSRINHSKPFSTFSASEPIISSSSRLSFSSFTVSSNLDENIQSSTLSRHTILPANQTESTSSHSFSVLEQVRSSTTHSVLPSSNLPCDIQSSDLNKQEPASTQQANSAPNSGSFSSSDIQTQCITESNVDTKPIYMEPAEMVASRNRTFSNIRFDDESELLDDDIDKINHGKEQETFEEALAPIFKGTYLQLDKNERTLGLVKNIC